MEIITNDTDRCALAREALYEVYDPEIGLNVVDLGLIFGINFDEKKKTIENIMTLTSQFCPMGESIKQDVIQALSASFSDFQISVTLTFDPAWSSDFISPEGQEFLNR